MSAPTTCRVSSRPGLRPSPEVIDSLAGALRLTGDETVYLYGLAGHAPPGRRTADETVDSLRTLVAALSPLPTMLVDGRFDIVAWNAEMSELMINFANLPAPQRNTIWLCVMHPALADFYRDREKILREGIADLRAAWAARPNDAVLTELVGTLCQCSSEFAELWQQRDVQVHGQGTKRLRHSTLGPLDVHYDTLTPLGDPEWRIYVYRAADDYSQRVLDTIVAGARG